ncbi:hypothetical protein OC846_001196 [Tilletia horrida]|uniref:Cullin family profile domain-containing protein n=1 Tax=Tilletia horrida TaxID=155126 RepID=A0AAN6JTQ9_9BASI|nr:hypothetical protein OC846_001196 [Tilletia horrida]KAK0569273.1 hypothetical protein OC861_001088 [Tilletia horrida]
MALSKALTGHLPFEACRGNLGNVSSTAVSSATGSRNNTTAKAIVLIKSSQAQKNPSADDAATLRTINEVTRSLRQLLSGTSGSSSAGVPLINLHKTVNNIVHLYPASASAALYDKIKIELERAAGAFASALSTSTSSAQNGAPPSPQSSRTWLTTLAQLWSEYCAKLDIIQDVLSSLDAVYIPAQRAQNQQQQPLLHVKQLPFDSLKNRIFEDEHVSSRFYSSLASVINIVRGDNVGSDAGARASTAEDLDNSFRCTHQALLKMAATLGHLGSVQQHLLEASRSFFKDQAQHALDWKPASDAEPGQWVSHFLEVAERWISSEEDRASWLWTATPEPHVRTAHSQIHGAETQRPTAPTVAVLNAAEVRAKALQNVEQYFILEPLPRIIADLSPLLDTANPRLATLYALFTRPSVKAATASPSKDSNSTATSGPISSLRTAFMEHVKERLSAIVLDKAKDEEMIERTLTLKAKLDKVVTQDWQGDLNLARALKDAMEASINKRPRKPAEMIAKYLDVKLKSGNKTMTDAQLEHALNEALVLFRFVSDKDMFEEVYKRHFAKRLLLNQSASSDAEQSMLIKLKEECGPGFTQQLETMLKDVAISTEIMQAFNAGLAAKQQADDDEELDLNVFVLTQAHWPTYAPIDVVVPPHMSKALDRFASFYQTRNSGRKLQWQHSLGTNVVKTTLGSGGKELMVSTFQTVVLLLFNGLEKGQTLSYQQIESATGLEPKELKRTLQSLACGHIPTRILRKTPQGKDINAETDVFQLNEKWPIKGSDQEMRHRIRINQIQMKETEEEAKQTEERVLVDRELVLQAAAVRILKAKKTVRHNELVNEVVDQVKNRFAVDVGKELKKTFELLIEKDYMERVEGDRTLYRYVA